MKLFGSSSRKKPAKAGTVTERAKPGAGKKRSGLSPVKKAGIALGVVLVLAAGAVAGYMAWEKPPERAKAGLVDATRESAAPQETQAPAEATAGPSAEPTEDPDAGAPASLNENMYTFAVVGLDQSSNSTDTIMIGRIDTENHTIDVVSIPRDTMVNVPWGVKRVNTLYSVDVNEGGNGIDGMLEGFRDLLGFGLDCYALVDLEAFVELVDAIGGVDYDVPIDMVYYDASQDLDINIKAGMQHLTGEEALKVVRFRKGYATADIGRIGTQQDFLKSVAKQLLTLGNIPNLPRFLEIFEEYVTTNMTAANISFFVRQFLLCKSEDINFHTAPGNGGDSVKGNSYYALYVDEWLALVNECLNPYDQDVTEENVNILTHSYETGFYTTTGVIEGGRNSFAAHPSYVESTPAPVETPAPAETIAPEAPPEAGTDNGTEAETGI